MNFNKIPDKLKTQALWCVWKQGKIPCNPRTGKNAQSNIPETFSDFETACNALEKGQNGKLYGDKPQWHRYSYYFHYA